MRPRPNRQIIDNSSKVEIQIADEFNDAEI